MSCVLMHMICVHKNYIYIFYGINVSKYDTCRQEFQLIPSFMGPESFYLLGRNQTLKLKLNSEGYEANFRMLIH